jgi:hypothetical protein
VTRRPFFTQAQLRTVAKIAKEHGVSVRLDTDGSVTISPISGSPSDEELDRELEAFKAQDREFVPWIGPRLNHREERVLRQLVDAEGHPTAADTIVLAGPATVNGLLSYGLAGLEKGVESFDRHCLVHATKVGLSFFNRRDAHYRRYPTM